MCESCENDASLQNHSGSCGLNMHRVSNRIRLEGKALIKQLPFDRSRYGCILYDPLQIAVPWNTVVGELVRMGYPREMTLSLLRDLRKILISHLAECKKVYFMDLFVVSPKMTLDRKYVENCSSLEELVEAMKLVSNENVSFGVSVRHLPGIKDIIDGFQNVELFVTDIEVAGK